MRYFLIISAIAFAAVPAAYLVGWILFQGFALDALDIGFSRIAKVIIILEIVILTVALFKWRGISLRSAFGFSRAAGTTISAKSLFSFGLITGLVFSLLVCVVMYLLEIRVLDMRYWSLATILVLMGKYLLTGLFIAITEEIFFRGAMMYDLLRENKAALAILLSTIVFTSLHFIASADVPQVTTGLPWYYGVVLLVEGVAQRLSLEGTFQVACALFLAGLLFAGVRYYTGSIIACIGIHAGWVMGTKVSKKLTNFDANSDWAFLIGSFNNFLGWLTCIVFLMILVGGWLWMRKRKPHHTQ